MPRNIPATRIVVAVSGASGFGLARALLGLLGELPALETHLIVSPAARQVMAHEEKAAAGLCPERSSAPAKDTGSQTGCDDAPLESLAHASYDPLDFSAPMASGSWRHSGMIVCPCSMASLAAIACGCGTHLLHRAADVALKERFPLVLATRETPLSPIHLANMLTVARAGGVIMPPCPAWYAGIRSLDDAARHFAARMLDQIGITTPIRRWGEANS